MSEGVFNALHIGDPNTLVTDRVLCDNIELGDILQWTEESLYIIHVKASFGNQMRELCSQAYVAATRLHRDLSSNRSFIEAMYFALQGKIGGEPYFDRVGRQTETTSLETFKSLFEKKIVFVVAVLDVGTTPRDIRNITEFNSNIAKFSLRELFMRMKGIDMALEVVQIRKPT